MDASNESISANQKVALLDFVVANQLFNRHDLGTNTVTVGMERKNQTFGPTPNFVLIPESQDEDIHENNCPVNVMGTNSQEVDKEDNIINDSRSNFGLPNDIPVPTGVCEVQQADSSLSTDNSATNTIQKQQSEDNIIDDSRNSCGLPNDISVPTGVCEVQQDIPSTERGPLPRRQLK
ncbi:PREDICTED: uncharacterized protein LOC104770143 [Camelina sativa]|uniref:Uncharacterized protein LOC104770143 n=1 Tax=Camelina sativa TaxID=90675 RepID=A0ABM0XYG6_CAMSA|nr:PREDICTED: uncharacterized protein LOC104770143 [Camelina sativa]